MKGITYRNRNEGLTDKNGKAKKPNWCFRFECASMAGKRQFYEKSGFSCKQEAVKAATKAYQEYTTAGSVFENTKMSYSDCLDSWLRDYVSVRCNPITRESYEKTLNLHIRPALGKFELTSLRRETIQGLINEMYQQKYSRNTLVNITGMINNSLRYAKRQGWIEHNPADDLDLPTTRQCTKNRKKVREPIPPFVIEKIFKRFPEGHPEHLPLMLGYHCGLRIGEAFGLAWDQVDLEFGFIYVMQQVQWSKAEHVYKIVPPKYDSKRKVSLDNEMWELLKREKKRQEEGRAQYGDNYKQLFIDSDGVLNTDRRGQPIDMVNIRPDGSYVQERTMQHSSQVIKHELRYDQFDYHSLRHTHATELSEAGVNIKEIQRRLGHSTLEITTRRYIHATTRMEQESIDIMNQMYGCENELNREKIRLRLVN